MRALILTLLVLLACGDGPVLPDPPAIGEDIVNAKNSTMNCEWVDRLARLKLPYLAFLWQDGGSFECLDRFFKLPKRKVVNVRLSDGSAERKGLKPKVSHDTLVETGRQALRYLSDKCLNCTILLTPQLEDNFSRKESCEMGQALRMLAHLEGVPARVNQNPNTTEHMHFTAECFDSTELHNVTAENGFPLGDCIYSNDGYDLEIGNTLWDLPFTVTRGDIRGASERFGDCIISVWTADGNCLSTDSSMSPPLLERECSNDARTGIELEDFLIELEGKRWTG